MENQRTTEGLKSALVSEVIRKENKVKNTTALRLIFIAEYQSNLHPCLVGSLLMVDTNKRGKDENYDTDNRLFISPNQRGCT